MNSNCSVEGLNWDYVKLTGISMGILGLWHVQVRSKPLSFFYLSSVFELNQEFSALY